MKRIIIFICIVFLFNGCSKLLDKEPLGEVSLSSAFITKDDGLESLMAVYNVLLNKREIGNQYAMWDIGADNAEKGGEGPSDGAFFNEVAYFTINSTSLVSEESWRNCYLGIHRANLTIKNVPTIDFEGNNELKERIIGEAKFLRAYFYFYLVTAFGDVPLITDPDVKVEEVKRDPKEQVYELIIEDLEDAANALPPKSEMATEEKGRATKGAAEAYLGKVYLYKHDFQDASKWFKKIINSGEYSLDPDFYHIFTMDAEFGMESIFEINYTYSSQYLNVVRNLKWIRQGSAGMYGYGFVCPTQNFIDEFESGDPRLWQTVYKNGDVMPDGKIADVGNSETGYMGKKAYLSADEFPPNGDPINAGKNDLVCRYGMVLLWYAESENENGNSSEALKYLNKIRKRARQGESTVLPDVTVIDQELLRKAIWHEERTEYGLENQRYWDLLRQNRLGEVMTAYSQNYPNSNKGKNFRKGVNELFPIPQDEIDLSQGNLTQNPGY